MPLTLPANEVERLKSLYRLDAIGADPLETLARVCRTAQRLFDVPMVAVTLLDADRQWIKASAGLEGVTSTLREHSFCTHAILEEGVCVVRDASLDPRFADNPHVTGGMRVRFYAGAPLETEPGVKVGSLCLIDTEPREFSADETNILRGLGRIVLDALWLNHVERAGSIRPDMAPPPVQASVTVPVVDVPLTSTQVRGARGLLNWSVRELAHAAGVSSSTIKRLEAYGADTVRTEMVDAIRQALEGAGAVFTATSKVGLLPHARCRTCDCGCEFKHAMAESCCGDAKAG